ncbi:MAG: L-aspartate oxidase [Dehalococcoidia bacterium]|nr:MAG: L-aspartate oxidase [Dehalococcoidia bacterium]
MRSYDYIIVGSGIAGLYCALLAHKWANVLLVTKGSIEDCNTKFAQGGIAAAIGANDSTELHFRDTITAGDGLCDQEAVHILVDEASDRIADLVNFGVPFDTLEGEIDLTLEAAHSLPRILHAGGDATGEHIELTLSKRVREARIKVLENHLATDIIKDDAGAQGLRVLNCETGGMVEFGCRFLIMATGGIGRLFSFTTNPEIATGDGIALAFKAGAEVMDMEFFQFHPTTLSLSGVTAFLISEAVRGEGGILRNAEGHRFMPEYIPEAELAQRDIVARSILYEMEKTGEEKVFLDITHLPSRITTARFPQIYRFCLENGIDITREWIPVTPAAHYMIGGIRVNSWGETNIPGLFAVGEAACTGVHGANRLASNSLLEVLVFGKRIIAKTSCNDDTTGFYSLGVNYVRYWYEPEVKISGFQTLDISQLQKLLWDEAGIIRSREGLTKAANILDAWGRSLKPPENRKTYELANLILNGSLMVKAALLREESRGAHFRSDFPNRVPGWQKHIVMAKR